MEMSMDITRWSLPFLFGSIGLCGLTGNFAESEDKPAANSPRSTHVLNTTSGKPASGMAVVLQMQSGQGWEDLSRTETDARVTSTLEGH
jgi:hypothetical protein